MRIARWLAGGERGEGFVIDDEVVPFPDGITVADVLARGLDAAHELYSRISSEPPGPKPIDRDEVSVTARRPSVGRKRGLQAPRR